ncbi:uncharacterized protein DDB_G0283357 isoform X2 [Anthonomus grandis grandis]|uniref:uncharacterized protein DDB_G0283357 isoform X2 n=1 Tax=Anthonomus grandis grandis TaxID=2921223 RepID=UPI0021654BBA|nr:uncharacterized protein DDB_G0283357 isoform X2 [Anthonomus grandis grandis]
MSVLNQSGEEQVECPLCMEPLEVDDLNFFPCTCGYQICRFCWHRIRLDENGGLCPACRKAYSENPADFIPLSREQVAKLKAEKRQRDQQRKAKLSESRKHLASVRVVQRNLVFVVGLPPRLADQEVLKRHEYFGKFGKIHKVVINQSTSYAGSQGPSASAYVTYLKSDDALRAIQAVNNVTIDNRVIKSSLGTTKYCSHFMKNQGCPKPDCMYLHEYDPEASFTREQMHAGKHQEYEKKLHEDLLARTKAQQQGGQQQQSIDVKGTPSSSAVQSNKSAKEGANVSNTTSSKDNSNGGNKENWPQLDKEKKQEKDKGRKGKTKNNGDKCKEHNSKKDGKTSNSNSESRSSQDSRTTSTSSNGSQHNIISTLEAKDSDSSYPSPELSNEPSPSSSPPSTQSPPLLEPREPTPSESSDSSLGPAQFIAPPTASFSVNNVAVNSSFANQLPPSLGGHLEHDSNSYFSSNGFSKLQSNLHQGNVIDKERLLADRQRLSGGELGVSRSLGEALHDDQGHQVLTDTLPNINTTEDWAAAFGFIQPSREQDHLPQKLQQRESNKLSGYPGFGPLGTHETAFGKGIDNFSGFYEISKIQENLMDALASKTNTFNIRPQENPPTHISNGLDHNMSKFFSDFHKFNNKEPPSPSSFQNGLNGFHNAYHHIVQQKQLEEQLMNLSLKQNNFGAQTSIYQNNIQTPTYTNGDTSLLNGGIGSVHCLYSKPQGVSPQTQNTRNSEAELDFDPFQETQKAFAEIMANEPSHKQHNPGLNTGRQINGLVHNQNSTHIPPPPPGFLQQQQTHMNSFGSKILPFLNMSNSQQQINSPSNNWPNSFNSQMQQKNITNTCNDWKVLDPAILSSSRSYQLPQMPPSQGVRDPYAMSPLGSQPQITQNGPVRPYEFPPNSSNPFSTFTQQIQQPNLNSFTHLNTPQNVNNINWFAPNDINSQISSPPGFRNSQTSKQQEC